MTRRFPLPDVKGSLVDRIEQVRQAGRRLGSGAGDGGRRLGRETRDGGRRLGRRLNRTYHRRAGRRTHDPGGIDVIREAWDLLVVLDACRYDTFAEHCELAGTLRRRRSRGSHTSEFLWGNFAERRLHDTVYVTANVQPYVYREALDLHHVEHVWLNGYDEETGTVPPGAVTDAALAAAERFPDKRLVVHYLQPHYPFLDGPDFEHGTMEFWDAVARGELDADPDQLRAWHERNLERAMPAVEQLLASFGGRAVVTADHGTALGERARPVPVREWGHPWGIYTEPLIAVPWLVREGNRRRRVESDPPTEDENYDEETLRERLDALGYV